MADAFDLAAIEHGLRGSIAGERFTGRLHHLLTTTSTNTVALAAAQQVVAEGVWIADEQTAGRGRGGHAWHSAAEDGLYVSVLVRPHLSGASVLKLSLAAGLACSRALQEAFEIAIDLRWPNDLMIRSPNAKHGNDRKFGGILTESAIESGSATLLYAVIGIGMNLNHERMPEALQETATSLRMAMGRAPGSAFSRADVLVALLRALAVELALLDAEVKNGEAAAAEANGPVSPPALPSASPNQTLAARFERSSTWVRGMQVHVAEGDGYTGVTDGLDQHGLLRVRLDDGTLRTVRHGGVRKLDGQQASAEA